MATSGTTAFDPSIDEIIEEAYERTSVRGTRTGYQLRSARRSLNILLSEWGNRGINLWKIKLGSIPLVEGQAEYNYTADTTNFPTDISDVLEAYVRNNSTVTAPVDTALSKIGRSTYSALPNKLSKGTPSQYFVQRFIDKTTLTVYPTADSTAASKDLHIYYVKRIQDADATYTDATDVPYRFVPCMASGLSFYLAQKYAPQRVQELKLLYEDELKRALAEDGSSTSTYITPESYYPSG